MIPFNQSCSSGPRLKEGKIRTLSRENAEDDLVLVVGLGQKDRAQESQKEGHDLLRESVRTAISAGVRSLRDEGIEEILVDDCGDGEAAAEGAYLGLWSFDFLKAKKDSLKSVAIKPLDDPTLHWTQGVKKAKGQNFARTLMETPANHLTPHLFAKAAKTELDPLGRVEVVPHDIGWIKEQKMGSFLSVSQGSEQDPVFLEMSYMNGRPGKN